MENPSISVSKKIRRVLQPKQGPHRDSEHKFQDKEKCKQTISQKEKATQINHPLVVLPQVMAQPPPTRMELIVASRYVPLALPQPMNALPRGDYLKYLPKYTGEGDGTFAEDIWLLFIATLIIKILNMKMCGKDYLSRA